MISLCCSPSASKFDMSLQRIYILLGCILGIQPQYHCGLLQWKYWLQLNWMPPSSLFMLHLECSYHSQFSWEYQSINLYWVGGTGAESFIQWAKLMAEIKNRYYYDILILQGWFRYVLLFSIKHTLVLTSAYLGYRFHSIIWNQLSTLLTLDV